MGAFSPSPRLRPQTIMTVPERRLPLRARPGHVAAPAEQEARSGCRRSWLPQDQRRSRGAGRACPAGGCLGLRPTLLGLGRPAPLGRPVPVPVGKALGPSFCLWALRSSQGYECPGNCQLGGLVSDGKPASRLDPASGLLMHKSRAGGWPWPTKSPGQVTMAEASSVLIRDLLRFWRLEADCTFLFSATTRPRRERELSGTSSRTAFLSQEERSCESEWPAQGHDDDSERVF